MKAFRILLLMLLAAMLPVRGVMAAALLCPPPAGQAGHGHPSAAAHLGSPAHAQGHGHHEAEAAAAGMAPHGQHHDAAAGSDTCNLCAACCSVPPVPSAAPAMPLPHDTAAIVFPSFAAPAPTFQSEGPERPPRSI